MDPAQNSLYVSSKRNKKIGLYWLLGPIVSIIVVLLLFAIFNSVLRNTEAILLSKVINYVLYLLGLLAVVAVPVGVIVGIIYLRKKELVHGMKFDERSGKGDASSIPHEIQKWNWGAVGLNWIWGVYHNVWISLLIFIPIVNIIMLIKLGLQGNEWAWRKNKWLSVEQFLQAQDKWKPWGIVFFVLIVLSSISRIMDVAGVV